MKTYHIKLTRLENVNNSRQYHCFGLKDLISAVSTSTCLRLNKCKLNVIATTGYLRTPQIQRVCFGCSELAYLPPFHWRFG